MMMSARRYSNSAGRITSVVKVLLLGELYAMDTTGVVPCMSRQESASSSCSSDVFRWASHGSSIVHSSSFKRDDQLIRMWSLLNNRVEEPFTVMKAN